jgi:hypothetical protein
MPPGPLAAPFPRLVGESQALPPGRPGPGTKAERRRRSLALAGGVTNVTDCEAYPGL